MCSKPIFFMRRLNSTNSKWMKIKSTSCPSSINCGNGNLYLIKSLSSGEAFTALKPFFFAVHPDLFGQFPKEREINENSLKRLNEYIESAANEKFESIGNGLFAKKIKPNSHLTFYLRKNDTERKRSVSASSSNRSEINYSSRDESFQSVQIELGQTDIRRTVHSILEICNLPTSYIDSIPPPQYREPSTSPPKPQYQQYQEQWTPDDDYKEQAEREIAWKKSAPVDLLTWLNKNVEVAKNKQQDAIPVREEIIRLRESLCKTLQLRDIIWDCGWGMKHFRGCLESLQSLADHHPDTMKVLKSKTIIFGAETGISMNGDVVLNSGEVRRNWLDVIRNNRQHDERILKIPSFQRALSRSLRDIKVVHRKFEPKKLAETYEIQLRKLTTSLGDYTGRQHYPLNWPEKLSHLELVVETEAGPLMVSPTGQIIVPSSCPPFLLVNFITDHMNEASQKLAQYNEQKYEERELHEACMKTLGLLTFEKADNVTPNLMIDCCKRLLNHAFTFSPLLTGTHLLVTTYYSVLTEGELCIPWNWK